MGKVGERLILRQYDLFAMPMLDKPALKMYYGKFCGKGTGTAGDSPRNEAATSNINSR